VKVAGGDKKKDSERIRLPGSGGRGPYRDDEIPLPKQIDPLAVPGGGGGRFRLPSLSRPSRNAGQPASKPTQPTTPPSGGARKAQVGGDDHLSKRDHAIEAGTERPFPDTPQLQKKVGEYLLSPTNKDGAPKAKWFKEALGFTKENMNDLGRQLVFKRNEATPTALSEWGQKYEQIIDLKGANGRTIPILTVWIERPTGEVDFVTAIPTNKIPAGKE